MIKFDPYPVYHFLTDWAVGSGLVLGRPQTSSSAPPFFATSILVNVISVVIDAWYVMYLRGVFATCSSVLARVHVEESLFGKQYCQI